MIGEWFYHKIVAFCMWYEKLVTVHFPNFVQRIVDFMTNHHISLIIFAVIIIIGYVGLLLLGRFEFKKFVYPWEEEEQRAAKKLQRQKEKERRARSRF